MTQTMVYFKKSCTWPSKILLGSFCRCHYILILLFLILSIKKTQAQDSDLEFALVNVGLSSIIGGVGAVINKEPDQAFGKVLLRGLSQGALGGYVVFESKRMLRAFARSENYIYVWPSKVVNAAGNSIIENAAYNRDFGEQWHLNIGFSRFDIYTGEKFKIQYRIMPFSLSTTIASFGNYSFDPKESLRLGTFVFTGKTVEVRGRSDFLAGTNDNIMYIKPSTSIDTKAHELVHIYQYEQFSGINAYLDKPSKMLEKKFGLYKIYTNYFYTDWNAPLTSLLYRINLRYEENLFEKEAEFIWK